MNYAANILVAILIATTAACVDSSAEPESTEHVVQVRAYHGEALVSAPDLGVELDGASEWDQLADPNGETEEALCACDSDECQTAWIEDNYGCGICIVVRCGDGGGVAECVACGPQQATTQQQPSKVQLRGVN